MVALPGLQGRFRSVGSSKLKKDIPAARPSREWTTARHLKLIDAALPGTHVKRLYDTLTGSEAQVLAQLRTGHSKLRAFLVRIGADGSDQCECGQGREDTRHFLFRCQRYQHLRGDMIQQAQDRYGDLSYMLGGRTPYLNPDGSSPDGPIEHWKPNLDTVRAAIKFAFKTGRLGPSPGL